ncbi:hypothetical protein HXX76_003248 [Chlamydomonas incerta]|uniref:inosine/xanthosine triphosphatase n=1 Tax=Chlamydomonas incerta TaxID=51695 RepID=A0A835W8K5_CHLIN|nr:hypothetical protein HXX76_003248 [Chlamydomonas incerta]|eukprot:KAG2441628.1 hypothetical protein HXX76_003248 [Chlamydomonas incerta]
MLSSRLRTVRVFGQAGPARSSVIANSSRLPHPRARLVLVASKNPVKVDAVDKALRQVFPELGIVVRGHAAPSGVPDQPHGDEETLAGARNRVAALSDIINAGGSGDGILDCDLVVAIEGGVGPAGLGQAGILECFAWVCAMDPHTGAESTARSASFALPQPLTDLLLGPQAMELGHADDAVFGRKRSGRGSGTIGRLSNGVLDRTEFHVHAVICALLPWLQPQLYGEAYGRFLNDCGEARQKQGHGHLQQQQQQWHSGVEMVAAGASASGGATAST